MNTLLTALHCTADAWINMLNVWSKYKDIEDIMTEPLSLHTFSVVSSEYFPADRVKNAGYLGEL